MQNYNTYTNDNIARQGLMNSYKQSQIIKPNELINDNLLDEWLDLLLLEILVPAKVI